MSLVNRRQVRAEILRRLKARRPQLARQISQVSGDVYPRLEQRVRAVVDGWIEEHPSRGKTFEPPMW